MKEFYSGCETLELGILEFVYKMRLFFFLVISEDLVLKRLGRIININRTRISSPFCLNNPNGIWISEGAGLELDCGIIGWIALILPSRPSCVSACEVFFCFFKWGVLAAH